MNYDAPINILNLKDPNKPIFMQELKCSFMNLTSAQEHEFFSTLLSHFASPLLTVDTGRIILTAIYKFLCQTSRQINFKQLVLKLPFSNYNYLAQNLDILYVLAEQDPNVFTKEVSIKFKPLIRQNPYKCLTILAILTINFEEFEDPWSMLDLLFSCKNSFIQNCPSEYINVMVTLCKKSESFLNARGSLCWSRICSVLKVSEKEESILTSYYGICKLIDLNQNLFDHSLLPYDKIFNHFEKKVFQSSVISLYLRVLPLKNDPNIAHIILILLNLAKDSIKAALILIRLAGQLQTATLILDNKRWLAEKIPTQIDTARLLLSIMKHENLKMKIINIPEFLTFLKNSFNDDNSNFFITIPKIIRRIHINESFVNNLAEKNLIQLFVSKSNLMTDYDQINSMLLLFDTIVSIEFSKKIPNFDNICNFLSKIIKIPNETSVNAIKVAIHYCKFQQCISCFKKNGIDTVLSEINEEELPKASKKLKNILSESV